MMKTAIVFFLSAMICCAQELKRPSVDMDGGAKLAYGCRGNNAASTAMPQAIDSAGLSTSSTLSAFGTNRQTFYKTRLFKSWQATGNTYSALTLNVNSLSSGGNPNGAACVKYSLNSGSTWTTIRCDLQSAGWGQITDTVTLSSTQSLATLQVAICAEGDVDAVFPGQNDITVVDIWTLGTVNGSQGNDNGSNSGNAHRGIVMIRYRKPLIWRRRELL